ncbi:hsp70 nucleotide exchange factor fes1 [Tilletia horrida]|nr:hsp70 nucleotide exchange factor fes1 [Tilletia horrida]
MSANDPNLNALLRWSIENDPDAIQRNAAALSAPSTAASTGTGGAGGGIALHASDPLAPGNAPARSNIPQSKEEIDAILTALGGGGGGGSGAKASRKSEADMMVEQMAVAMGQVTVDGGKVVDHEDRVVALDNFEMLIESIDNANLLLPLKLWTPLLSLLHAPTSAHATHAFSLGSSSSSSKNKDAAEAPSSASIPAFVQETTQEQMEEIQAAAAWIIGTAVQNNPKCQTELLTWGTNPTEENAGAGERPVTTLLRLLLTSRSTQVRNKSAYALSALLKHYPAAVRHLSFVASDASPSPSSPDAPLDLDQTSCLAGWGADADADGSSARDTSAAQAWFAQHYPTSSSQRINGWTVLGRALLDPSMLVRRKVAFLINSLLLQWAEAEERQQQEEQSKRQEQEASSIAAPLPAGAPAELPPETMRQGSLRYEGVLAALVEQGVLRTLLLSLLPEEEAEEAEEVGPEADAEPSVLAGANGDEEPRRDEDYAEKAVRAVLSFGRCVSASSRSEEGEIGQDGLPGRLVGLYGRLVRDLEGSALGEEDEEEEGQGQGQQRWEELGLERAEVEWLSGWVAAQAQEQRSSS